MNNKIKNLVLAVGILSFTGCVGPASYTDAPNSIQRAEVMTKNKYSITIEHSNWGKKIAFRLADEHCASLNKIAIHQLSSKQNGSNVISTWKCKK